MATPWPRAARVVVRGRLRSRRPHAPAIRWVEVDPRRLGRRVATAGAGIDLILGGSPHQIQELADTGRLDPIVAADPVAWREVSRPEGATDPGRPGNLDPRDDPAALAEARAVLDASGWAEGYTALMRRPVDSLAGSSPAPRPTVDRREVVALVRGGRHRAEALEFLAAVSRPLRIRPAPPDADLAARTDDLLADLLGAALVDARNERRDAQISLAAHGHPAVAEASLGEAPPWPPASVVKLRNDPARANLADVLAAQMVTDPEALDWLEHSWRRPGGQVDLALLREVAQAVDGRLAREPRFRAWLRGEWTAWTQQLDRRVARLAGGYRPQ